MRNATSEYRTSRQTCTEVGSFTSTQGRIELKSRTRGAHQAHSGFEDILSGIDEIRLRLERLEDVPRVQPSGHEQIPEDMRFHLWLRRSYRERLLRREAFDQDFIVSDPSWDMLLDLCISEIEGRRISVTSLCLASGAPTSTALRWIGLLEHEGMIERQPDPSDRRRIFVRIAQPAFDKMFRYFRRIGNQ